MPQLKVNIKDGKILNVEVLKGAPCGATWDAAEKLTGLSVDEAAIVFGLQTQFFCTADPAGWDPINGKSPVHLAADIHKAALLKKLKEA